MKPKQRTWVVVTAPLVAVATLMVGLRVGAGSGFRAALVHGAPPGRAETDDAPRPYVFQITTYFEDRGVREAIPMKNLTAVARTVDGQESVWNGESNADGIAEMALSFKGDIDHVALDLRAAGESDPIAFGIVNLLEAPARFSLGANAEHEAFARVRPSKREGAIQMDVFIESGRLVVGSQSSVWVHVSPETEPATNVHAAPEIGVNFTVDDAKADCQGWAELPALALGQAASTLLEAKGPKGETGTWFGTLPTAPGAFAIRSRPAYITDEMKPAEREAIVIAPNPRTVAYVEIDDTTGREWAAALPLVTEGGDPLPRAHVPLAQLHSGVHYLVVSGDPRGAEKLSGATMVKQVWIGTRASCVTCDKTCDLATSNARFLQTGFPRFLAIDGIATRGAQNRSRHRTGLLIGLLALGAAALLEVLLLTQASREARLALAAAETDEPQQTSAKGGNLVVALLVALLGFAFLAALMVAKA